MKMMTTAIEAEHEVDQRQQHRRSARPDREGDRAEGAERRKPHDDVDELEERVRDGVQAALDRGALVSLEVQQCRAEDDGDHQHLQQFALGEGPDEVVREDVQDEVHRRVRLSRRHGRLHAGPGGCSRNAFADPEEVAGEEAEGKRDRRDDLEVEHGHEADLADALEVSGRDNANCHAQENERRNGGLDQTQEDVAQDLELCGKGREQEADRGAEHHGDDDLEAEVRPQ